MENWSYKVLFLSDLIILVGFFFVVFTHYNGSTMIPLKGNILIGIILICWFIISVNSDVLKIHRTSSFIKVLKDILIAYSVLSTVTIAIVATFGEFRPNDKLLLYPLLFSVTLSTFLRMLYLTLIKFLVKRGYRQQSVLLIGSGRIAKHVFANIITKPEMGFRICGILSDGDIDPEYEDLHAGGLKDFYKILNTCVIDQVIITISLREEHVIRNIAQKCEEQGTRFCIVPNFCDIIPKWRVMNSLGGIPLITTRNEPLNIFSNRIIKRSFDISVSIAALLLLAPVLLIIAVIISYSSPGPVLFRQKRIGNNNREFMLYKFRTMIVQSYQDSDSLWTTSDDKRITPLGKILRKTNLDELPQLWNVLVGDMSIVGPRPERAYFVEKFSMDIPNYRVRHLVKSGITGLAQANGWRGNTSIQKRIENDLYYLENWSLWLDLKIIFMTFFNPEAWKNAI